MKIATWNVNGVRAREAQVQEFLDTEQPDILCLQESAGASTWCSPATLSPTKQSHVSSSESSARAITDP
jgi:exonuclease III